MRERLIQAAVHCIAEKGYVHATSAEISARAGVSSGARVHHFKAMTDLVIAAVDATYERAAQASLAAAAAVSGKQSVMEAFIGDTYAFYSGPAYLLQHEVINAARTSEVLMAAVRPAANRYRAAVNAAWLGAFLSAGHSRAWTEAAMELSVVLVRGLALGSFLRGRERDDEILRLWKDVMNRLPDEGNSPSAHRKRAARS